MSSSVSDVTCASHVLLHEAVEGGLAPPVLAHGGEHGRAVARLEALRLAAAEAREHLTLRVGELGRGGGGERAGPIEVRVRVGVRARVRARTRARVGLVHAHQGLARVLLAEARELVDAPGELVDAPDPAEVVHADEGDHTVAAVEVPTEAVDARLG
eukprot:scaffold37372_cov53-Phaeocystis_antarctica.AAC.3